MVATTAAGTEQTMTPSEFRDNVRRIEAEIAKTMVGQAETVRDVVTSIIAGGHVLLEGVPGLGKTLLVRTLAEVLDLEFSRIQFTPDLMPADITGTNILAADAGGQRRFVFQPGPIFANLVLADEINRATPKTQSALLEAMQEKTVTIADQAHHLPQPFFVLATQNPLEMEGTYPLPEAQLDRFFYKLIVRFPSAAELGEIVRRTTTRPPEPLNRIVDGPTIQQMSLLARQVPIATHLTDYVVRVVLATHAGNELATPEVNRFVRYGASPRAAQAMVLGAKIRALVDGRFNVSFDDIRGVAIPALRHRLLLNFEAEAADVSIDQILRQLVETLPET